MSAAPHTSGSEHERVSTSLAEALGALFLNRSSNGGKLLKKPDSDSTIREALTSRDLFRHASGAARFGAIPFVDADRVGWGCIDIDARLWGHDPDAPEVFAIIDAIVETLALFGLRAVLERSKSKGWHVWIFFDVPAPAADVRALLLRVALEAGAKDAADLVCPRQDRLEAEGVGNGMWLPLFGGDKPPHTRFNLFDPDAEEWLEAEDQVAFLLDLVAHPAPSSAIPPARQNGKGAGPESGERHACSWILDELAENGVALEALAVTGDKIQFACPIPAHVAKDQRRRGGSAVFFSPGSGSCASSRCNKRWRNVTEFLDLIGVKSEAPRLHVLTREEFEADAAPQALVADLIYLASTHNLTGASKAGKTWAALQLAMAVASGETFLGMRTTACRVLLLSFELSAGMVRGRMREISAGTDLPMPKIGENLYIIAPTASYVPALNLGTDAGAAEIARVIAETGAELVIFDTLYRFLPGADPNDNGEMGTVYGRLNSQAQQTGAAFLLLDHQAKGEQFGPVSHSGIGASVKGGAARVVISLKRTSREDGGRWQLDCESHFGSWDEPLHFERPRLPDGTRGGGVSLCTATEAHGLKRATVRDLFVKFGEIDLLRRRFFGSKRKLREALIEAKLAGGNGTADPMIDAILHDFCAPEHAADHHPERPILTRPGPRDSTAFVWRETEANDAV